MVVFCCSVCGESLKKNQVQKHYSRCRMSMVSCMDCSHEFWNDDYQEHIKCISEEEKYSGKDYKPRPGQNKGEAKQDAWLNQVQQAIDNSNPTPKLRSLLERLKDYPNIPRKQAKFQNFIRNSLRADHKLASSVWEILMSAMPPKEDSKTKENGDDVKDNNLEAVEEQSEKIGEVGEEEDLKKKSKRERKEERRKEQKKEEKKDLKKQKITPPPEEEKINGECDRPAKKKGKKRKRNDDYYSEDTVGNNDEVVKAKKIKKKSQVQINDDDDDGMPPLEPNPNHACPEKTQMEDSDEENNVCGKKNGGKTKKKKLKLQRHSEDHKSSPLEAYPNVACLEEAQDEEEEEEEEKDSLPKKRKKPKTKFNWEQTILSLLRKSKEKSMSEKKLRKKVIAEYMDQDGHIDSMSILKAKFDRKIKKNQQLLQKKDKVCLQDE